MREVGSSPHARGTQLRCLEIELHDRFIPACAGNACAFGGIGTTCSVHPRMRGERHFDSDVAQLTGGSSPHARGTPSCTRGRTHRRTVHPRMRGERSPVTFNKGETYGSSPHARGTLYRTAWRLGLNRFIPACAGNAMGCIGTHQGRSVHPRMRGERLSSALEAKKSSGSSPHARGTHHPVVARSGAGRFIPACAGNADSREYQSSR